MTDILLSYEDEATARMVAEHLDDFDLWSDYKGAVVHKEAWCGTMKWCLVLPEHTRRYSITYEKMTSSASDFLRGYRKAQAGFSARMETHFMECTPKMVGEPLDGTADEPKYWVTKVTKAGSITLSRKPPKKCKSCGYNTVGARSDYCRSCTW